MLTLPRVERLYDVGVLQLTDCPHFAFEAGCEMSALSERWRHQFKRHRPLEPGMYGLVDSSHTATAEQADDAVIANHCPGGENHRRYQIAVCSVGARRSVVH